MSTMNNVAILDYDLVDATNIAELNLVEINLVGGGVNGSEVADGVIAFGGATLAIALAPEVALGALAVGSYWAISAAAGYLIGHGLASD